MKIFSMIYRIFIFVQSSWHHVFEYVFKAYLKEKGVYIGTGVKLGRRVRVVLGENSELIIKEGTVISDDTWIIVHDNSSLVIDEQCFFSHHCIISSNSKVEIGEFCAFGPFCIILDTDKNFSNPKLLIREQGSSSGPIKIERDVWIGASSIVLKNVNIESHSVIAAQSVVNRNIVSNSLNGGIPTKQIKKIGE